MTLKFFLLHTPSKPLKRAADEQTQREILLVTCDGKIRCARCQAMSTRTKNQCGRPALKGKRVCQFHGGRSTGPKTKESKEQLRLRNLKHGFYSHKAIEKFRKDAIQLRYLEDIAIHIGMFHGRMRGRKPKGYLRPNLDDPSQFRRVLRFCSE